MRGPTSQLLLALLATSPWLWAGCSERETVPAEPEPSPEPETFLHETVDLTIPGTEFLVQLEPIPGGTFTMGCPPDETGAQPGESPPHRVRVSPFWMAATEVTWDAYRAYQFDAVPDPDGVTGPTPPYVPMDFGMGVEGFPAISMTQYAARQFCKWLSLQTGEFYRLPTEAEWEFACRAGSDAAFHFGADPALLDEHAWHAGNAEGRYHRVAQKDPNPFGLYDMHGNVAEWVMDGFEADLYVQRAAEDAVPEDPVVWPQQEWGRVVRGGSWDDPPAALRSAARRASAPGWKMQDPQFPKSIWYLTDARFVGFRIVRPMNPPPREEWDRWWDADVEAIRKIQERQARGER